MFFAQQYADANIRMFPPPSPPSPHATYRSSIPLHFVAGTIWLEPLPIRVRCAACEVRKLMWNGVVNVTVYTPVVGVFAWTLATSIACPIGRESAIAPLRP